MSKKRKNEEKEDENNELNKELKQETIEKIKRRINEEIEKRITESNYTFPSEAKRKYFLATEKIKENAFDIQRPSFNNMKRRNNKLFNYYNTIAHNNKIKRK